MPIFATGFVLGNVALHGFSTLPSWGGALLPALLSMLLLTVVRKPWACFCGAMAAGFLWSWIAASEQLRQILPAELEGRDLQATIRVTSIPKDQGYSMRFDAETLSSANEVALPRRLRLSFYQRKTDSAPPLRLGDVLDATLRLKRPYGYMNPGGFDYERYLFSQRIGATGYVRQFEWRSRADASSPAVLRYRLYERLRRQATLNIGGVIALTLGERGLLGSEARGLLFTVGIGHLFAISGLHIALVFGFIFLICRWLWSRFLLRVTLWPSTVVATIPALLAASAYAWLAGFTIPTQRALIMLACVAVGVCLRRRVSLVNTLPLALVVVVICDPLSTLSATLWLSFIAVGFIALYFSLHPWPKRHATLYLQVALPLALLPAGLYFFGYGSLAAVGANLIAVPLVSLLILPCALLTVMCAPFHEGLCALFAQVAGGLLEAMWRGAALLAQVDFLQWFHRPPVWSYPLAIIGIVVVMLVHCWRHRVVAGILLLLPLMSDGAHEALPEGAFEATFLDVGQGLAVVVETRTQALLYDTGPAYASGFSTAEAVIVPYLNQRGVRRLDKLIVSHGDNDHAGGIEVINRHFDIGERLGSGVSDALGFSPCWDGQVWMRDGVRFEILHPVEGDGLQGNEASCVLKVSAGDHALLLTADIEHRAEASLLRLHRLRLKSSAVLVPHHGSLTSSGNAFVAATRPDIAVVTSGYRNRFGFPKQQVVQRYLARCAELFNTAETGALKLQFIPEQAVAASYLHRRDSRRYWRMGFERYSSGKPC